MIFNIQAEPMITVENHEKALIHLLNSRTPFSTLSLPWTTFLHPREGKKSLEALLRHQGSHPSAGTLGFRWHDDISPPHVIHSVRAHSSAPANFNSEVSSDCAWLCCKGISGTNDLPGRGNDTGSFPCLPKQDINEVELPKCHVQLHYCWTFSIHKRQAM